MPFKPDFERRVNTDLEAGSPTLTNETKSPEDDIEFKLPLPIDDVKAKHAQKEEDKELTEKTKPPPPPPRFSTLYGPDPGPGPVHVAPCFPPLSSYPPHRRRSGVFVPMPLFIILAITLFFESTLLFAYTLIGLYNTMTFHALSTTTTSGALPASNNIALQIFNGHDGSASTTGLTVTLSGSVAPAKETISTTSELTTSTSTPVSTTPSTTSSTTSPTSNPGVAVTTITPVVFSTFTPKADKTKTKTKTKPPPAPVTVTSIHTLPGPTTFVTKAQETGKAAEKGSGKTTRRSSSATNCFIPLAGFRVPCSLAIHLSRHTKTIE